MTPGDLEPAGLYHLAGLAEWDDAASVGVIAPASLVDEGFIHCSWGAQVAGTVARHFPGRTDLVALQLDPDAIPAELVVEDLYGTGQAFPHVYGVIPASAVLRVVPLT